MNNEIFLFGEVGYEITLENVIEKIKETNQNETLTVNIHSEGGNVFEGLAIYNYLKGLPQEVHTVGMGLVASIASIFFLAGSKRTLSETSKFLIHLPSAGTSGNAKDFEKTANDLRVIESELSDIYALETSLTKKEAMSLMEEDKFSEVSFLQKKNFITDLIELKAVAKWEYKSNTNKMSKEQLTKDEAKDMFAKLTSFISNLGKKEPKNKTVTDANGDVLNFTDVEADANIELEMKAEFDNKPVDGERLMPNGDKWNFENGILKSIDVKEVVDVSAELKEEIESLKEELATAKSDLEVSNQANVDMEAKNKSDLEEVNTKIETISNALGSNFNYEGKEDPKNKKETNERIFKIK